MAKVSEYRHVNSGWLLRSEISFGSTFLFRTNNHHRRIHHSNLDLLGRPLLAPAFFPTPVAAARLLSMIIASMLMAVAILFLPNDDAG